LCELNFCIVFIDSFKEQLQLNVQW